MKIVSKLAALAMVSMGVTLPAPGIAESAYPSKAVSWVVPFPPGGVVDNFVRKAARELESELGQTIVVENKPGAAGMVGTQYVARAPADGYTLLTGTQGTMAANMALYEKLQYNVETDFVQVHGLTDLVPVLWVRADSQYKTVQDLVDYAKKNPGALTMASSGVGALNFMTMEQFRSETDIQITHIPYKGSVPALTDIAGGVVDAMFDYSSSAQALVDAGRLRGVAVAGKNRSPSQPNVPTTAEAGYPGVNLMGWLSVVAPAGTPDAVVQRLSDAFGKILKNPELVKFYENYDARPLMYDSAGLAAFTKEETGRWADLVKSTGVKLE
ncbi:MAG: tripartite tricarboxylate transporter substrate binding protein [Burkholderiaceae bacterium]